MQSLLSVPSPNEDAWVVNLADWLELTAWFSADRNASREDLIRALRREGDTTAQNRIDTDTFAEEKATHVFKELRDRETACGRSDDGKNQYPFMVSKDASLLSVGSNPLSVNQLIYLFLLLVSKSDMSSSARKKVSIDPTKVFESLCRDVLEIFWGGPSGNSGVLIFGTSQRGVSTVRKFRTSIDDLCNQIGEGMGWRNDAIAPGGGDGGVDLVAWRKFSDGRQGGLIGFGQSKTGIHWQDHLAKLTPSVFSRNYMVKPLVIPPYRLYMVPVRISEHRWESHTGMAGLLLDRCRIVEYASSLSKDVLENCQSWSEARLAVEAAIQKKVHGQ
jgi:hypothetical protein